MEEEVNENIDDSLFEDVEYGTTVVDESFFEDEEKQEVKEKTKEELIQEEYTIKKNKLEQFKTENPEMEDFYNISINKLEQDKLSKMDELKEPEGVDRFTTGLKASAMSMANPFIAIGELSEDISNWFRDKPETTWEDFRIAHQDKIKALENKLGYKDTDIFKPSLGGQIAGETAAVMTGQKALTTAGKVVTTTKAASLEGVAAFLGEFGSSGDYVESVQSGALAGSITGVIGRVIEGRELNQLTKDALDDAPEEELVNIANMYEFAKNNNIKIVDAMLSQNPNKIISELKSFNAPDALVEYAESLKTDTGKKLLGAFNDVFKDIKPDSIEDLQLRKISQIMQKESISLKKDMTKAKDIAYNTMKESELKNEIVNTNEILDIGMEKLSEFRGDSSLVNAFKRNVLKNVKNLDSKNLPKVKRIQSLEAKIARNEDRMAGMEINGISTEGLEKTIAKDNAELDKIIGDVDMTKIDNITLEDMVGIIQDMNELKYSGSAHVATKGAKEQRLITELNEAIMNKIDDTNPEFGTIAKDASDKAREIFQIFGKQGRGTHEFPELEKIRMSDNPDDYARLIFKTDALESGYKIEKVLEHLGTRSPALQKKVIGKYVNDAIGGFDKYTKGKNTVKQSVLNLDESTSAIDKLIGSPDSKRLTEKLLGKENVDTLFTMNNFIKEHKSALDAMTTPSDKREAEILSAPFVKQAIQVINYVTYKAKNTGIFKDKYHSVKYEKKVNKYIKQKLEEFSTGKKNKMDWNKLSYSISGGAIEKAITESNQED